MGQKKVKGYICCVCGSEEEQDHVQESSLLAQESCKHWAKSTRFWKEHCDIDNLDIDPALLKEGKGWLKVVDKLLQWSAVSCPFLTVTHGDPRIDNWYFPQRDISGGQLGLLDWQIMMRAPCQSDVTWFACTSFQLIEDQAEDVLDSLFETYWTCLVSTLRDTYGGSLTQTKHGFMGTSSSFCVLYLFACWSM